MATNKAQATATTAPTTTAPAVAPATPTQGGGKALRAQAAGKAYATAVATHGLGVPQSGVTVYLTPLGQAIAQHGAAKAQANATLNPTGRPIPGRALGLVAAFVQSANYNAGAGNTAALTVGQQSGAVGHYVALGTTTAPSAASGYATGTFCLGGGSKAHKFGQFVLTTTAPK